MSLIRMNSVDIGDGSYVQIDATTDQGLLLVSSQNGQYVSKIDDNGIRTSIVATTDDSNLRYGNIQQLTDGKFAVYGTTHAGLGRGADVQIYNADGSLASSLLQPMGELDGNVLAGTGYTLTPTQNGGFGFVWTSDALSGNQLAIDYLDGNGNAVHGTASEAEDVRIRYYDATGNPLAASLPAATDVESIGGGATSRLTYSQFIMDSETLGGGGVAFVYGDQRFVGSPGGGAHTEIELSVQVSTPGSAGTPVKVDLGIYNEVFGTDYPQAVDGSAGANIVVLPNGGFAVIWTETAYVADASVWGNYRSDGWNTDIRYFDAAGNPLGDATLLLHRGPDMGNITKYVWANALPDGRIAIAYQDGIYGVNGNGQADAYLGIVGQSGASLDVTRVNSAAAVNTVSYTISDLAVRSDGTIDVSYVDNHLQPNGFQFGHTVVERFSTGAGVTGAAIGGSEGNDVINSGNGATNGDDLLAGGGGNDAISGAGGNDRLEGGNGDDRLLGNAGSDRLEGGEGNDTLTGGLGNDLLFGGGGSDIASFADASSAVNIKLALATPQADGNGGFDILAGIEGVTGSSFDDFLTGDANNNALNGGAGNDILTGGAGNDALNGFSGIDTASYLGASAGVIVNLTVAGPQDTQGGGIDTLVLIENLRGSAFDDTLTGNAVPNVINGAEGNDKLFGDAGNDNLVGAAGFDTLNGGDGQDRLDGGDGGDVLNGDAGNDNMLGGLGDDLLRGGAGNDIMDGGAGNDVVQGDGGRDKLAGGIGADYFTFTALADSTPQAAGRDTITDFSAAQGDRIDLSAIDAIASSSDGGFNDGFTFVGAAAFSHHAGELRAVTSGANFLVQADVNGDGVSDFALLVASAAPLVAGDFVL